MVFRFLLKFVATIYLVTWRLEGKLVPDAYHIYEALLVWHYSVGVITQDFDLLHIPETQVRTLVVPLIFISRNASVQISELTIQIDLNLTAHAPPPYAR